MGICMGQEYLLYGENISVVTFSDMESNTSSVINGVKIFHCSNYLLLKKLFCVINFCLDTTNF